MKHIINFFQPIIDKYLLSTKQIITISIRKSRISPNLEHLKNQIIIGNLSTTNRMHLEVKHYQLRILRNFILIQNKKKERERVKTIALFISSSVQPQVEKNILQHKLIRA